jgi:hypothetical protein
MGDAGEGLIDADARIQERMDELEREKKSRGKQPPVNPERVRERESLRLARTELQRQLEATTSEVRKKQLAQAIAELEKRIAALA